MPAYPKKLPTLEVTPFEPVEEMTPPVVDTPAESTQVVIQEAEPVVEARPLSPQTLLEMEAGRQALLR